MAGQQGYAGRQAHHRSVRVVFGLLRGQTGPTSAAGETGQPSTRVVTVSKFVPTSHPDRGGSDALICYNLDMKINQEKIKNYWQRRHYRYSVYLIIILAIFFGISSILATTFYNVLPDSAVYLLPDTYQPTKTDKVLVLSPHPDDETIAVGGYDYEAIKAGAQVEIALVTDGNKHGWQTIRYKEFKNSASIIGIPEKNLEFWDFKEGMTNDKDLEPIKDMIVAEIKTYQPTVIIAPMIQDAHFDHHLIGQAYLEAVAETNYSGYSYGYLVHHRFFPQPKHYAPNRNLMPPIKYLLLGNGWSKFMMSPEAVDAKNEAVLGYHSQLRIPFLKGLLKSMIRQNEVFLKLN